MQDELDRETKGLSPNTKECQSLKSSPSRREEIVFTLIKTRIENMTFHFI